MDGEKPAVLTSFVYLKQFLKHRSELNIRSWALDSGAFSALNSGTTIDLVSYTETCKELLANDELLTEVFALDVIGDPKASRRNTEYMWKHGVPAIPCYHLGSPESELKSIAKEYDKIAIGGMAKAAPNLKFDFIKACFQRVWPKKIHGFAVGQEKLVMAFPFHSTDATNWEMGPCAFGRWDAFKGAKLRIRGSNQNLRSQVEFYLALERKAQQRWTKEMALLQAPGAPSVELGLTGQMSTKPGRGALGYAKYTPKKPKETSK